MRNIGIAVVLLVGVWTVGMVNVEAETVTIVDRCDPDTFNADPPTGPGLGVICQQDFDGGVTFEEFGEILTPSAVGHPAWRFNAPYLEIAPHEQVRVINHGGEDHTFTEVPEVAGQSPFGGGRLAIINTPLGLTPLDICQDATQAPVIHPGDSVHIKNLSEGTHYFQCCIHPWMHGIIEVASEKDKDHTHHDHD
jgi:plastocyanin